MKHAIRSNEKRFALWRCKKCEVFNVRGSRRIEHDNGRWTFLDTIQSPCPKCGYRQRMQVKDVRLFLNEEEALDAKELASGRWL